MTAAVEKGPPRNINLDLGEKVYLCLVWIEPMKLFVGKYEVTNAQFRRFNPSHNSGQYSKLDLNGADQPAVNVSWNDAQAFCQWLTKSHGLDGLRRYEFRLPTEKEWMVFAACGRNTEYPWGPDWGPPKDWNYYGRENKAAGQKIDNNDGFQVSCPVQRSGKNAWGLFGTGGNVWEWCADAAETNSTSRVFKGGSWLDCHPYFLNLARRSSNVPDNRYVNRGFRVVAEFSEIQVEKPIRVEVEQR
jgi:formylglycine-generating enzyme required for sulfatase activity